MDARERLRELSDFAAPWSVWIAATLRLPDLLGDGPASAEELAARAGADPGALRRLLAYLVARGVFAETDGGYANTPVSELLRDDSGWRSWFDLDGAPGVWAESWTRLLTAVRTGSRARDEGWYYEELARTGRAESFDAAMAVQAARTAGEIASVHRWGQVEHVVDVGGGNGTLLRALLAARPHLRGTLFDLPQVVAGAEPADRLAIVAGDLFADPLPRGDVYVLSADPPRLARRARGGDPRGMRRGRRRGRADPGRREPARRAPFGRPRELRPLHAHARRRPGAQRGRLPPPRRDVRAGAPLDPALPSDAALLELAR